jgi:hypothetical protein
LALNGSHISAENALKALSQVQQILPLRCEWRDKGLGPL